eukprot:TRINITY_DN8524_c0_g1_i1.p1 TRINITY_DN8524_c0_g1~~TRINITY_DN8524_c0_g1_i1.p1  ORF type:complete len:259 (-),score=17.81 TRINITY_DN8524_c0_g1_i1:93-869(-)
MFTSVIVQINVEASGAMVLLKIIRKTRRKEREMRLLMVGLDNAGKTTIVKRINDEDVNEVSPTLGFNIKSMEYLGYQLNIWDVGGQKTLRSYWKNYFEQTDGLIWVVDSSDRRRLAECAVELHQLLMEERLAGASLLIFANKQDVSGALNPKQIADAMRLQYITNRHWEIVACSAKVGTGVSDGFNWIVKDVGSRVYLLSQMKVLLTSCVRQLRLAWRSLLYPVRVGPGFQRPQCASEFGIYSCTLLARYTFALNCLV